jgi:AcrR family transcriptional regulator
MGAATPPVELLGSHQRTLWIQRRRILDAMTLVAYESSFAQASVSTVSARAKVSRHTFYEIFDSLEDCFLAVLDDGARCASLLVSRAFAREATWLDGVRAALASLLELFESEPALAHVLLVEASAAGPPARERRERHLAALRSLIEDRWGAPDDGHAHPLATAGVMASLLGVLHTHLVFERREPLIALLGPLMGLVTAPYLDPQGVACEIERGGALAREMLARRDPGESEDSAGGVPLPGLLLDPRAHRARACLLYLAARPGASNRQIARTVGIGSDSHISTLLARMQRVGLIAKRPSPPGGPNAWSPSPYGLRVADALTHTQHTAAHAPTAASAL